MYIVFLAVPISGTCVHDHISPLLGEHPRIVKKKLGPVTVHYREVSLYYHDDMYTSLDTFRNNSVDVVISATYQVAISHCERAILSVLYGTFRERFP